MSAPTLPSPKGGGRIIVEPPIFEVGAVRDLLNEPSLVVEAPSRPWEGDDVVGLLVWQSVTEEDMARLPGLRVIVTGSIGFDHIDLEAARRRRIWVCNTPDYCVDEVADTTIALLLALVRGTVVLDRSVRAGQFDDHAAGPLDRISDIRLGIVGFGRIGRAVARRALGLGMETWATDALVPDAAITAAGVKPASLDELLRTVNALTLHLPFTKAAQRLISSRELGLMPQGSYLVNTARGQLVDTSAVLEALETRRLAGGALDVLPVEPPTREWPVPSHPRLIVTPHAAWLSAHAETEVVRRAVASMRALLEGREPDGVVVRP